MPKTVKFFDIGAAHCVSDVSSTALRFRACGGLLLAAALSLPGCGAPTLDLAGYPDAARDRLYRNGRLGDDKGLMSFDLRKAWRGVADTGDTAR